MITVNCPNCGEELGVEEETHRVAIVHEGHAVQSCPVCGIELAYEDGELVRMWSIQSSKIDAGKAFRDETARFEKRLR